ncbi:MAG: hypothetical protein ABI697_05055 [Devosia sp.]
MVRPERVVVFDATRHGYLTFTLQDCVAPSKELVLRPKLGHRTMAAPTREGVSPGHQGLFSEIADDIGSVKIHDRIVDEIGENDGTNLVGWRLSVVVKEDTGGKPCFAKLDNSTTTGADVGPQFGAGGGILKAERADGVEHSNGSASGAQGGKQKAPPGPLGAFARGVSGAPLLAKVGFLAAGGIAAYLLIGFAATRRDAETSGLLFGIGIGLLICFGIGGAILIVGVT